MSYSDDDEFGPDPDWMDGDTSAQEAKEDHFAASGQPGDPDTIGDLYDRLPAGARVDLPEHGVWVRRWPGGAA